jgi:hypothetical protein
VLNAYTAETCQYANGNEDGLQFNLWHDWLPDGRLMTLNRKGELVALDHPCQGQSLSLLSDAEAEPPCLVTNPDSNQTCSPGGSRLAETMEARPIFTTTVVNTASGEIEAMVTWTNGSGGIGHIGGPQWLAEDRFIIHATDEGPLMVTLGEGVQVAPIASTFFGLSGAVHQYAEAVMVAGTQSFHGLLHDYGSDYTSSNNWLYHSESGEVEALPFTWADLSPDGRWLDLQRNVDVEGYERYERWLRSVDPAEAEARQFLTVDDQNNPGWSADWQLVAVASPHDPAPGSMVTISAHHMPDGAVLHTWPVGAYGFSQLLWSPDSHFLAAIGNVPQELRAALFLLALQP